MGATNFPPPAPFHLGSRQFSLKHFLKSCTFTENLFVNVYICHFHFLSFFFSPLVTGNFRRGGRGREGGGQNLGLRVEKREGGVR